jgi:hypothetical protein
VGNVIVTVFLTRPAATDQKATAEGTLGKGIQITPLGAFRAQSDGTRWELIPWHRISRVEFFGEADPNFGHLLRGR